MPVIAFYNIKGGVGKTTAAVNCAHLSAQRIGRTLLCDLDPQGSASYYLRAGSFEKPTAKKLLSGGKTLRKTIRHSSYDNLDILPADFSYRKLDIALSQKKRAKKRFAEILRPMLKSYRLIILDAPPNITLESENILRAADYVLVPVIPTTLCIESCTKLITFLTKKNWSKSKLVFFFSKVDQRRKLHREIVESIRFANGQTLESTIPYCSDIEKMGSRRAPVLAATPKSRGSLAFVQLWDEIESKVLRIQEAPT